MPFEDGKYKPDDVKTFSTVQGGMGKARKNTFLKGNGIPGPGQYKIKGFAEKIADEGRRIREMREKAKKDREQKELEMKMRNGQIENEKNIEQQKNGEQNNDKNMVLKISDTDLDNEEDGNNDKQE